MRHGTTEDIKLAVRLAIEVLQEPDPFKKAELTEKHFKTIEKWRTEGGAGEAEEKTPDAEPLSAVPDKPRRSDLVNIVESRRMKSLGKGGSLKSRMAIVHSLAHIESWVRRQHERTSIETIAIADARSFAPPFLANPLATHAKQAIDLSWDIIGATDSRLSRPMATPTKGDRWQLTAPTLPSLQLALRWA